MKLPLHEFSFVKATAPYSARFVAHVSFIKNLLYWISVNAQ